MDAGSPPQIIISLLRVHPAARGPVGRLHAPRRASNPGVRLDARRGAAPRVLASAPIAPACTPALIPSPHPPVPPPPHACPRSRGTHRAAAAERAADGRAERRRCERRGSALPAVLAALLLVPLEAGLLCEPLSAVLAGVRFVVDRGRRGGRAWQQIRQQEPLRHGENRSFKCF